MACAFFGCRSGFSAGTAGGGRDGGNSRIWKYRLCPVGGRGRDECRKAVLVSWRIFGWGAEGAPGSSDCRTDAGEWPGSADPGSHCCQSRRPYFRGRYAGISRGWTENRRAASDAVRFVPDRRDAGNKRNQNLYGDRDLWAARIWTAWSARLYAAYQTRGGRKVRAIQCVCEALCASSGERLCRAQTWWECLGGQWKSAPFYGDYGWPHLSGVFIFHWGYSGRDHYDSLCVSDL